MFPRFWNRVGINVCRYSTENNSQFKKISDSLSNISNIYTKQSRTQEFKSYVFNHPFKAYFKVGSVVFGGVFTVNTLIGLTFKDTPVSPYEYPQSFAWMNLTKSMYFGLIWPSVPFMLLNGNQRYNLCVLGGGMKSTTDEFQKQLESAEKEQMKNTQVRVNITGSDDFKESMKELKKEMNGLAKDIKDMFK